MRQKGRLVSNRIQSRTEFFGYRLISKTLHFSMSLDLSNNPLSFLEYQDFKGQKWSERVYHVIIIAPSFVGFIHGYFAQDFYITFLYWLAATVTAMVICVPGWPWLWQRNGVQWLKEVPKTKEKKSADTNDTKQDGPVNPQVKKTS